MPLFRSRTGLVAVLYKTQNVTIGNTAAETNIFSATIPGGALGTTGRVAWSIYGNSLNNSGAVRTFTLKVKLGSTTLYAGTSATYTAAADRRPLVFHGGIQNIGATNSQVFNGEFVLGSGTAPTTGIGAIAATMPLAAVIAGTAAEDTTTAKTLTLTLTHSIANASLEMLFNSIVVELF